MSPKDTLPEIIETADQLPLPDNDDGHAADAPPFEDSDRDDR